MTAFQADLASTAGGYLYVNTRDAGAQVSMKILKQ